MSVLSRVVLSVSVEPLVEKELRESLVLQSTFRDSLSQQSIRQYEQLNLTIEGWEHLSMLVCTVMELIPVQDGGRIDKTTDILIMFASTTPTVPQESIKIPSLLKLARDLYIPSPTFQLGIQAAQDNTETLSVFNASNLLTNVVDAYEDDNNSSIRNTLTPLALCEMIYVILESIQWDTTFDKAGTVDTRDVTTSLTGRMDASTPELWCPLSTLKRVGSRDGEWRQLKRRESLIPLRIRVFEDHHTDQLFRRLIQLCTNETGNSLVALATPALFTLLVQNDTFCVSLTVCELLTPLYPSMLPKSCRLVLEPHVCNALEDRSDDIWNDMTDNGNALASLMKTSSFDHHEQIVFVGMCVIISAFSGARIHQTASTHPQVSGKDGWDEISQRRTAIANKASSSMVLLSGVGNIRAHIFRITAIDTEDTSLNSMGLAVLDEHKTQWQVSTKTQNFSIFSQWPLFTAWPSSVAFAMPFALAVAPSVRRLQKLMRRHCTTFYRDAQHVQKSQPRHHLIVIEGPANQSPLVRLTSALAIDGVLPLVLDIAIVSDIRPLLSLLTTLWDTFDDAVVIIHYRKTEPNQHDGSDIGLLTRTLVDWVDSYPLQSIKHNNMCCLVVEDDVEVPPILISAASVHVVFPPTPPVDEREWILTASSASSYHHVKGASYRFPLLQSPRLSELAEWGLGLGLNELVLWPFLSQDEQQAIENTEATESNNNPSGEESAMKGLVSSSAVRNPLESFQRRLGLSVTSRNLARIGPDDVGGDQHQSLLTELAEAFQDSGAPSGCGLLLFGPPGCGKTLLAKAAASSLGVNFLNVKGPELLDKYVGESERKVRALFREARAAAPCLVFLDELDALAPRRGRVGDAGGAMDRVVSQLATEISESSSQRNTKNGNIFVLGATNRPDLLDTALLRPGRLERRVFIGPPKTHLEMMHVLSALTRKFTLNEDVELHSLVCGLAPGRYTGADFYGLCSDVQGRAVEEWLIAKENNDDEVLIVSARHFEGAIKALRPSLSLKELNRYEAMR